jgi:predicted PurR-regulated permease PerM
MSESTNERMTPQAEPAKLSTTVPDEGTTEQRTPQTELTKPETPMPGEGVVWVRFAPSQVVRTVVIALLSAVVVLGALYLLWQARTIIGWTVLSLFLAVTLNPAVNWLERRRIPRSIGILLTYLGLVVALIVVGGIFVPLVVSEILALINFIVTVAQTPGGFTEFLSDTAEQYGVGWLVDTLSGQLADLPSQLGAWAKSFLLSTGGLIVSTAGLASAGVTIITRTFMML